MADYGEFVDIPVGVAGIFGESVVFVSSGSLIGTKVVSPNLLAINSNKVYSSIEVPETGVNLAYCPWGPQQSVPFITIGWSAMTLIFVIESLTFSSLII